MPQIDTLRTLHESCNKGCITYRGENSGCKLLFTNKVGIGVNCDICDSFPNQGTRPDFIVLPLAAEATSSFWFVVEMKPSSNVSEIIGQLQAGASVVENDSRFRVEDAPDRIVPLVLKTDSLHQNDRIKFQNKSIRFRGRNFPVLVRGCGIALQTVLGSVRKGMRTSMASTTPKPFPRQPR